MEIILNSYVASLKELINECRQIYTGWCLRGKKDLSLTYFTGKFNSGQYWNSLHNSAFEENYELSNICNPIANSYVGVNYLWLRYNRSEDKISIYRRTMRAERESFFNTKTRYSPCCIDIDEFNDYCIDCGLKGEILEIKKSSEKRVCGDLFILSGSVTDFAKAGWQDEYNHIIEKEKSHHAAVLETGRNKIAPTIPLATKLYYSKLMKEILLKKKHYKMDRMSSLGIFFAPYGTIDHPFIFSEHGYRNIASEEEFIALMIAYICVINHTPPDKLSLEKIEWTYDIDHYENDILYIDAIRLPFYPFSEKSDSLSKSVLKDLLD